MTQLLRSLTLAAAIAAGLAGCTAYPAPRGADFVHVVLFRFPGGLREGRELQFLSQVEEELLPLPMVQSLWIGHPYAQSRQDEATPEADYDLGMVVLFAHRQDMQSFVDHPTHVNFLRYWSSSVETRVFDFEPRKLD